MPGSLGCPVCLMVRSTEGVKLIHMASCRNMPLGKEQSAATYNSGQCQAGTQQSYAHAQLRHNPNDLSHSPVGSVATTSRRSHKGEGPWQDALSRCLLVAVRSRHRQNEHQTTLHAARSRAISVAAKARRMGNRARRKKKESSGKNATMQNTCRHAHSPVGHNATAPRWRIRDTSLLVSVRREA